MKHSKARFSLRSLAPSCSCEACLLHSLLGVGELMAPIGNNLGDRGARILGYIGPGFKLSHLRLSL